MPAGWEKICLMSVRRGLQKRFFFICGNVCPIIRRSTKENCLILMQLLLNLLPIVWPNMTENAGRILRLQARKGILLIITNSSHLPVEYTTDIFDALDIQDDLQTLYTSGTVFHAFIGEKLPDWKAAAALVRKIAENYKLPYYTISPTYSVCKEHGYISGEHFTCPKCGKKAEVYSRITGYYRPVQNWNDGKAQEYKNRTLYDVMHSDIRKIQPVHASVVTVTKDDVKIEPVASHKYLFTTSTCPNCRVAKKILEGREFDIIDAEKNPEMVKEFGLCGSDSGDHRR